MLSASNDFSRGMAFILPSSNLNKTKIRKLKIKNIKLNFVLQQVVPLLARVRGPVFTASHGGYVPEIAPFNAAIVHKPEVRRKDIKIELI